MTPFLWLGLALTSTALGQVFYKGYALTNKRALLLLTIISFCTVPPSSFLALRDLKLSTVYMSTAAVQFVVVLLSMILFKERFQNQQWLGLFFILTGVVIFNL